MADPNPSERTFTLTVFPNKRASVGELKPTSWAELCARLTQHPVGAIKDSGDLYVPGRMERCPTPCHKVGTKSDCRGGQMHRVDDNVEVIELFVADIDKQPQARIDELITALDALGLEYIYSTTHSNRPPESVCARLIFPLEQPITITDARHWVKVTWPALMRRIGLDPAAAVTADKTCCNAGRMYYWPYRASENAPHTAYHRPGKRLSADGIPAAPAKQHLALVKPLSAPADRSVASRYAVVNRVMSAIERPEDLALMSAIASGWPLAPEGKRHDSIVRATWLLARHCPDISDESLLSTLEASLNAMGEDEGWHADAEKALEGARGKHDEYQAEDIAFEALQNEQSGDDAGFAARYVRLYGNTTRYMDAVGFYLWDGQVWKGDPNSARALSQGADMAETYKADLAELEATLRIMKNQLPADLDEYLKPEVEKLRLTHNKLEEKIKKFRPNVIGRCRQSRTIEGFLKQARRPLLALPEDFDSRPWEHNAPNGIVNLATGALSPHAPEAMHSKLGGATYNPDATAPLFERVVAEALPDPEVRAFFQRAIGYALTGDTREDILFILLGSGGNGKSLILNTIKEALGDYAGTAPKSLLMSSKFDRASSDELANLRGVRLCGIMELNERERLDSSRLKTVVGGDRITARRLYENAVTFTTEAKLFMPCNSKPRISDDDPGAWQRIAIIEFPNTFRGTAAHDRTLPGRLRGELEGVLAWCVRGCMDWAQGGLRVPERCRQQVEEYRAGENDVARFVEECVERGMGEAPRKAVYDRYKRWAADDGLYPKPNTVFTAQMRKLGFEEYRKTNARFWRGIKLID